MVISANFFDYFINSAMVALLFLNLKINIREIKWQNDWLAFYQPTVEVFLLS